MSPYSGTWVVVAHSVGDGAPVEPSVPGCDKVRIAVDIRMPEDALSVGKAHVEVAARCQEPGGPVTLCRVLVSTDLYVAIDTWIVPPVSASARGRLRSGTDWADAIVAGCSVDSVPVTGKVTVTPTGLTVAGDGGVWTLVRDDGAPEWMGPL